MATNDSKFSGFKIGYKYEVGTKEYIDMVYKTYNLIPYEYMKPEKISDFNNPHVVKAYLLHEYIASGNYMYDKNVTYKNNYIKMMEQMGIPDNLINIVRSMSLSKFIGSSDMFPYMKDYYDYLKGYKKFFRRN